MSYNISFPVLLWMEVQRVGVFLVGCIIRLIMNNTVDSFLLLKCIHLTELLHSFWVNEIAIIQNTYDIKAIKTKEKNSYTSAVYYLLRSLELILLVLTATNWKILGRRVMRTELCFIKSSWQWYEETIG